MPVLAKARAGGHIQDLETTYVLFGCLFLFILGLWIHRQRHTIPQSMPPLPPISEKAFHTDNLPPVRNSMSTDYVSSPLLPTSLIPMSSYEEGKGEAQIYYSPVEAGGTFDQFMFMTEAETIPRRRSYTKTTVAGAEVSGEITVAEGWRRHTRVFDGGVCLTCVESERRMTA
ncbi:hypothetical protein BJ878DRAFT_487592 [Calycina marina]|uniref:Uncharacterized protein n=1 Tax=Calycina marina TaxID=1763456 RepID=A0A9P7ZAJ9_9HELO|nr:hypothetical protein BJ878DRAFT_487592 [Calycina marina]